MTTEPATIQKTQFERQTVPVRRRRRWSVVFALLVVLLALSMLAGVSFGSTAVPLGTVVKILLNGTGVFHFSRTWDATTELIIWQLRLPEVVAAAIVGAALSVAGALFQGILRNPLADPFLIGTSSGASLGATLAFILPLSFVVPASVIYGTFLPITPIFAFIGAMASVLFVYAISRTGGRTPVVTLLLAGVVVNTVLVALQSLIVTLSAYSNLGLQSLFNWVSGGISVVGWLPDIVIGILVVVALVCAMLLAPSLDVFALGEEQATHLGFHVERRKFIIIIIASLLTSAAVSISGLISFVGLIVPHVMRLLLGPRHRMLLPASALGGAIFLVLADLLARTLIAPSVLPVGIFTALVGAPFFLFLLRGSKREYRW